MTRTNTKPSLYDHEERGGFEVAIELFAVAAVMIPLYFLGLANYPLLHVLVEFFSISVALSAFLLVWNMRARLDSGFPLFVATAYAASGSIDLFHAIAFKDMGGGQEATINVPMQLWMAGRFVQAGSLLLVPFFMNRPRLARFSVPVFAVVVVLLMLSIFRPWPGLPGFPACVVEGAEATATPFKTVSQWVVIGLFLAGMGLMRLVRAYLHRRVLRFMAASLACMVAAELLFIPPMAGKCAIIASHLFKALAFYLVYKALVEEALMRPVDVLFRSAHQSREQVQESEERFRTLAAATFEGIIITENGRIVDVNEQLLAMLGRRRAELIGESLSVFLVPEDRERVLRNLHGGLEGQLDYRMTRADGTVFYVEAHGKMVDFKKHSVRVTAIRDISQRKKAEESLVDARNTALRAARELARSNQDLEQFAHVTSHDLKEPLRMVTGFMGLLRDRYESQLDEKAREYIGFASDAARRMQRLIDDLLEYSRIGRDESIEVVALSEVLDEAQSNLSVAIRESEAAITRDPLPVIRANRTEMVQLFQNLLGNALKFRGARPPEIHVGAREESSGWVFTVRDNGIGIDPAYQGLLFKIFQRMHTTEAYPGSGVGLAICKKIVEQYGGRIGVQSEEGRGATFYFTLPETRM
ncbi:MAG: MASE3 domain-containing protein [Kiritimatiellia bacterium]